MSETGDGSTIESEPSSGAPKASRRRSLATRLTWAFVSVAVVSLLGVGLVLTLVSYNAQVKQVVARQQETADGAAVLTSEYLRQAQDTLSIHGQTASLYGLLLRSFEIQQRELDSIMTSYGSMFQTVTLLGDEGNELAKVSPVEIYNPEDLGAQTDSLAFQQALQGRAYIDTETQLLPYTTFPTVKMAVPINPREGTERRGVLMADVSVEGMWDAVSQVEVGETGYAYIVDRATGELIAHSDPERSAELQGQSLAHIPIVSQVISGTEALEPQYQGLEGDSVIGAASPLRNPNWTLIVELPTQEALADVRQMLVLLAVLMVPGVLAAAGLGLIIPPRIVRPLSALREGAREIGAGKLDHVIQVDTRDEIQDLAEAFNQMATDLRASSAELERWGHELEAKVEERTHELAGASTQMHRRAVQLETSAEVARAITSVRDLDLLLPQVAQSISERFGWYHVGIFLLDEARGYPGDATGVPAGEAGGYTGASESGRGKQPAYAWLRAANSEGGQRMLKRGHRLKVGEQGIVGYVTHTGQPRIALDVGQDAVFFDNPDLPDTRSEMALPLVVGGWIIGALDVQSTESAAYDEEDVTLLRILADQVAIAIENARLFERTQQALNEVQTLHRQYIEREWTREAAELRDLTYEYRQRGTAGVPVGGEAKASGYAGEASGYAGEASDHSGAPHADGEPAYPAGLVAPIKIRDQVIGILDLQDLEASEAGDGTGRQWSEDEIALVQAISDQVGLALENARLFADTQRRTEQMTTINRIGLSVNSDLDLRGVLNALYEELRRILDAESFYVALYDESTGLVEFPLFIGANGPVDMEPQSIDQSPGLTGYVLQSRQPLHLADLQTVPEDAPYHMVFVDDLPTRSYIGVPLIFRDQVIGVLSVQSSQPNAYTEEDVELLVTVATQASTAIENARAYQRLAETAKELRESDRFKTQFLANMSHELRTPLNSIIGFSRVMLKGIDGPITDVQQADLRSIYSSGQHLLGLINSILDMSKIEAGKMELSFGEVFLPDILNAVLSTTKALVKDRPIVLHSDVAEGLPTVWADSQRVRQVLLNLMSNAAKFTEEGHIRLRVGVAAENPDFVTISVADTGVGIEPEAQDRLFIPFQQVDGSTTRRAGGTGLGLAISRTFVEMHGGKIWAESRPGKGSIFTFTLPIYRATPGTAQRLAEDEEVLDLQLDPDKKVVLAIDDEPGVITLLKRYLESDGYQVVGVTRSLHALKVAQRLASELTAITLDVMMPNSDGWQVLRALKQNPRTRDIPVILVSIVDGVEQGLELGAVTYLRKPITRTELLQALKGIEAGYVRAGSPRS